MMFIDQVFSYDFWKSFSVVVFFFWLSNPTLSCHKKQVVKLVKTFVCDIDLCSLFKEFKKYPSFIADIYTVLYLKF